MLLLSMLFIVIFSESSLYFILSNKNVVSISYPFAVYMLFKEFVKLGWMTTP
jgi:hypothetical protein